MAEPHRFPKTTLIPYSVERLETYEAAVYLVNSATDNPAERIELRADRYLENAPLFFQIGYAALREESPDWEGLMAPLRSAIEYIERPLRDPDYEQEPMPFDDEDVV